MITLGNGDVRIRIDERDGARATSWTVAGLEILGAASGHEIDRGMYPMAPWAGRIRGNRMQHRGETREFPVNFAPWAIHGLVLSRPFSVLERSDAHAVLESEFGEPWPVPGSVRCGWSLADDCLITELSVTVRETCPAVVGWHPWFVRTLDGSHVRWHVDSTQVLVRGEDALPTGERRDFDPAQGSFDDALLGGHRAAISWPGVLSIDIENSHPYYVVYDGNADHVCIEPQTGPPNGLSGEVQPVTLVTVDQPLTMSTRWSITRAQRAA